MAESQTEFARRAVANFADKAVKYGSDITVNGQVCRAFPSAVRRGDETLLAIGAAGNSAFPDMRVYMIAPGSLPLPPQPQQIIIDAGVSYTIIAVPPPERVANVAVYESLYAYLTPPDSSASAQGPTEAHPGTRVDYRPKSADG